jgi:hypothetical protein
MKTFFIGLLIINISCATKESKIPTNCQCNLTYCLSSYDHDHKWFCDYNSNCSQEYWNFLCQQDFNVCKIGYGYGY